ncbi:MAG: hypothetical protein IKS63_05155, partial [Firmicutes bacterium]|nr:hypothetical protein [Bacillota bacterium]
MNTKRIRSRILSLIFVFTLIFSMTAYCTPVHAYDEVNRVSFTVGYWAGNKEYTNKEISLSELASACGTHQQIYTWIANGSTVGTTEAEGVYISDILEYVGIDRNSVYYYNFFTSDGSSYQGAAKQWQEGQLFGTRYSCAKAFKKIIKDYNKGGNDVVENPEKYYTLDNVYDYDNKRFSSDAWDNRSVVEPMLALRTKGSKWKGYTPASWLDFSGLGTAGKPILMFGQAQPNEITRNLHAQMVNKVHIWFEGSPTITLKATNLKGKVGSKKKLEVQVNTPDEYLTEQVIKDLSFSSSNKKAAKVSSDGTVTFTGEGAADISVEYDGKVYDTLTATGQGSGDDPEKPDEPDDPDDPDDPEDDDNGDGNGSGTTSGDGDGNGGSDHGSGSSSGAGDNNADGSSNGSISTDGKANIKPQGSEAGEASGSGQKANKVYEISTSKEALAESIKGSKLFKWIMLLAAIAIICGGTGQAIYYRSQT